MRSAGKTLEPAPVGEVKLTFRPNLVAEGLSNRMFWSDMLPRLRLGPDLFEAVVPLKLSPPAPRTAPPVEAVWEEGVQLVFVKHPVVE